MTGSKRSRVRVATVVAGLAAFAAGGCAAVVGLEDGYRALDGSGGRGSGGGASDGTGGDGGAGGMTGAGSAGWGGGCTGTNGGQCRSCCEEMHQEPATVLRALLLGTCACKGDAPCNRACDTTDSVTDACDGTTIRVDADNAACEACIQAEMTSPCASEAYGYWADACAGELECDGLEICLGSCPE